MIHDMELYTGVFDIIGTAAFAVSGAMSAARKRMDVFGIAVTAVITAAGGGVMRDIIMGNLPPALFKNPRDAIISAAAAAAVFIIMKITAKRESTAKRFFIGSLPWLDAPGLAAFTVTGAAAGIAGGYIDNKFLVIFLGTVTGVGGGVLRDITLGEVPIIFKKQIYAVAAAAGAAVMVLLYPHYGYGAAAAAGFGAVMIIRAAAIIFDLNLPSSYENE